MVDCEVLSGTVYLNRISESACIGKIVSVLYNTADEIKAAILYCKTGSGFGTGAVVCDAVTAKAGNSEIVDGNVPA